MNGAATGFPGTARWMLIAGSVNGALAVILGAFGAHALKSRLAAGALSIYHTGNQYHFYHSLAMLGIGLCARHLPSTCWIKAAAILMLAGTVVFSGSLYILAFTGQRWLGALAPVGGSALIAAWIALTIAIIKAP